MAEEYKTYDKATLDRLHRIQAMMLNEFNEICSENGIEYFASFGTAIGAIRHGGFIPWDDDIDLCLRRKDYDCLREVIEQKYSDKYEVIDADSQEHYPMINGHLILKNTVFVDEAFKDLDCTLGIFLDLFPYDNLSDDDKEFKKQAFTAWWNNKLMIIRELPHPVITVKGFKGLAIKAAVLIGHYFLRIAGISNQKLYKKSKRASTQYNDKQTSRIGFLCDTNRFANQMHVSRIYPLKKLPFEDTYIWVPNDIDEQLRAYYGDYMQLPPEDNRKNHYPARLDFGPYSAD